MIGSQLYTENTFYAVQSTFRYLEMHLKLRHKICICSVILGELESFRNYEGFSIIFTKILDAILRREEFYFITFLNPRVLDFLF